MKDSVIRSLAVGERLVGISVAFFLAVGVGEILVGLWASSVALLADGVQSLADASVSIIVWMGLRLSRRAPDGKFHFGYRRVETLAAIFAAFVMMIFGALILYQSYQVFTEPRMITHPLVAALTAGVATAVSIGFAMKKWSIASEARSPALRADAANAVKDGVSSLVALFAILFTSFGFVQMDALGGIAIAGFVFWAAYLSIREASLVLVDACSRPDLVDDLLDEARNVPGVVRVDRVRLRKSGPHIVGELRIEVEGDLTVHRANEIIREVERRVKAEVDDLGELIVVVQPAKLTASPSPSATKDRVNLRG